MPKNIFLSFSYKDKNYRDNLRDQFQAHGGPIQATPLFVTEDVSSQGEQAIKNLIRQHMARASGLLVVLGEDVHNSPWIAFEVQCAKDRSIPIAVVRHPQATGGVPNRYPELKPIAWDPKALAELVAGWK